MSKQAPPTKVLDKRGSKPGTHLKNAAEPLSGPDLGHIAGTVTLKQQARGGDPYRTQVIQTHVPLCPRLLDLHAAAAYLGLSPWKVRELETSRVLARVRIPLAGHGEVRKLLFDKHDLDRLIES